MYYYVSTISFSKKKQWGHRGSAIDMQTSWYKCQQLMLIFSLTIIVGYYQLQYMVVFLFRATVMRKVYQRSKLAAHYSLHDGDMLHLLRYVCGDAWKQSCRKLKTFVQNNCGTALKGSDRMQAALCWLSKVHFCQQHGYSSL